MFIKNSTHFTAIDHDLIIPIHCAKQTHTNNIECRPYFTSNVQHQYIMQCRNNKVFATWNLSFTNPKLEKIKLSFVPAIINSFNFPIRISDQQVFADQICGQQK